MGHEKKGIAVGFRLRVGSNEAREAQVEHQKKRAMTVIAQAPRTEDRGRRTTCSLAACGTWLFCQMCVTTLRTHITKSGGDHGLGPRTTGHSGSQSARQPARHIPLPTHGMRATPSNDAQKWIVTATKWKYSCIQGETDKVGHEYTARRDWRILNYTCWSYYTINIIIRC